MVFFMSTLNKMGQLHLTLYFRLCKFAYDFSQLCSSREAYHGVDDGMESGEKCAVASILVSNCVLSSCRINLTLIFKIADS